MKIKITIIITLLLTFIPINLFATSENILTGKSFYYGTSSTNMSFSTTQLTDSNLTNGYSTDSFFYTWTTLTDIRTIDAYQIKITNGLNTEYDLLFYDTNQTLLQTIPNINVQNIYTTITPVPNVKKVVVRKDELYTYRTFNEIALFAPPLADTTPPEPPTNIQQTHSYTSATITWSPSISNDVSGYNVYRNGTKQNTTLITETTYSQTNLLHTTNYTYYVTSVDSSNNESLPSGQITFTTLTPDPDPDPEPEPEPTPEIPLEAAEGSDNFLQQMLNFIAKQLGVIERATETLSTLQLQNTSLTVYLGYVHYILGTPAYILFTSIVIISLGFYSFKLVTKGISMIKTILPW